VPSPTAAAVATAAGKAKIHALVQSARARSILPATPEPRAESPMANTAAAMPTPLTEAGDRPYRVWRGESVSAGDRGEPTANRAPLQAPPASSKTVTARCCRWGISWAKATAPRCSTVRSASARRTRRRGSRPCYTWDSISPT
jgi:hypothetical protein